MLFAGAYNYVCIMNVFHGMLRKFKEHDTKTLIKDIGPYGKLTHCKMCGKDKINKFWLRIIWAVAFPTAIYGRETLIIGTIHKNRINSFELRTLDVCSEFSGKAKSYTEEIRQSIKLYHDWLMHNIKPKRWNILDTWTDSIIEKKQNKNKTHTDTFYRQN